MGGFRSDGEESLSKLLKFNGNFEKILKMKRENPPVKTRAYDESINFFIIETELLPVLPRFYTFQGIFE